MIDRIIDALLGIGPRGNPKLAGYIGWAILCAFILGLCVVFFHWLARSG
jgi:hypothetical protein